MRNGKRGFTLIELLIVIAIIAILALIAIPNFLEAQTRSKVSAALAHMRTLATAIEAFRIDNNCYPANWTGNGTGQNYVEDIGDPLWTIPNITNPSGYPKASLTSPIAYISSVVKDPFMMAGAYVASAQPAPGWSRREDFAWQYGVDVTCGTYWMLGSFGPDRKGSSPSPGGGYPGNTGTPGSACVTAVPNCFLSLLITEGPDATRQLFFIGASPNSTKKFTGSYDPTNGTISDGDIYRTNLGEARK